MLKPIAAISAMLFMLPQAYASGDEQTFRPTNKTWQAECGSCHVAYPVRMLPATSWKAIMAGLDKHFGTDASVDAVSAKEILAFLEKNAGRRKVETASNPPLRITETNWFLREHDEIRADVWKRPQVKSAANCAACHTQAERGDFNEHNIRVPK